MMKLKEYGKERYYSLALKTLLREIRSRLPGRVPCAHIDQDGKGDYWIDIRTLEKLNLDFYPDRREWVCGSIREKILGVTSLDELTSYFDREETRILVALANLRRFGVISHITTWVGGIDQWTESLVLLKALLKYNPDSLSEKAAKKMMLRQPVSIEEEQSVLSVLSRNDLGNDVNAWRSLILLNHMRK